MHGLVKEANAQRDRALELASATRGMMRRAEMVMRERCAFIVWCHGHRALSLELLETPLVSDDDDGGK
jgi:hypothetical protein